MYGRRGVPGRVVHDLNCRGASSTTGTVGESAQCPSVHPSIPDHTSLPSVAVPAHETCDSGRTRTPTVGYRHTARRRVSRRTHTCPSYGGSGGLGSRRSVLSISCPSRRPYTTLTRPMSRATLPSPVLSPVPTSGTIQALGPPGPGTSPELSRPTTRTSPNRNSLFDHNSILPLHRLPYRSADGVTGPRISSQPPRPPP